MFNKWSGIIGGLLAGWYFVKKWLDELSKIIEPLVKEIEQMALDGKIDKAERKTLVMKAIKILEEKKIIKLNFISRIIVGFVVDKIAQKLPDFKVKGSINELLGEIKEKGISFKITIPWIETKEDAMGLISKVKEMFAWRRVLAFLKVIFKGGLLLIVDALQDLAIEAAKQIAEKGLPTDEAKRHEFERIMRQKAKEKGLELKDSVLNLLREQAVAYLKIK